MTGGKEIPMADMKIQQIFHSSWRSYARMHPVSEEQHKAASSIISCKTGILGVSVSVCDDCGHKEIHNNSCRNRHCPNCQAVLKEEWIDARRSEVIDGAYFHVVFTIPAELRPVIFANQSLLYSLMHDASSKTLLELLRDRKYLGATPALIQVLHTWGQDLHFHPHIHCIVSGAGLTPDMKLVGGNDEFLVPVKVLGAKFRGKFLDALDSYYRSGRMVFPDSCIHLRNRYEWSQYRDSLYKKNWCPYIKETFNGFGNAIDYLGRYTHRIAISNSRIENVSDDKVSFWAKDYRSQQTLHLTLSHEEFIRRFMLHVLPKGFQKIRYYGLLTNSRKKKLLSIVFRIQNHRRFQQKYATMKTDEKLMAMFGIDVHICPCCGSKSMRFCHRTYYPQMAGSG